MTRLRVIFASLGLAATVAGAQMQLPGAGARAPRIDVVNLLGLDATRATQVETILQQAHEKVRYAHEQIGPPTDETTRATMHAAMEAIRSDTDAKLGTVLTADELAKLHAAMPPPRIQPMRFNRG
jgi:protein CpxP